MARAYDTRTTADIVVRDLASHIAGTTVLVTGASSGGLGAIFAEQIAQSPQKPKLIILAARSEEKVKTTIDNTERAGVRTKFLQLDLSSFKSVRESADQVLQWDDVIDVLVNNAGIMAVPYGVGPDGYENQLTTNHLSPFLFTNLIMEKILASKAPRIVNVSSDGHRLSPFRFADYGFHVSVSSLLRHLMDYEALTLRIGWGKLQ
jgi:NAD(P)-dependent dehydrogenase (short-subunit alcohol dehydrogenase family)